MQPYKYNPNNHSGLYRHRISFQTPSTEKDSAGFPVNEPVNYLTTWAKLKTLKGGAFYAAAQNNMQHNREFTIRYRKELDDELRPVELKVIWKNIEHEIVSIENDNGLNETMTVIVKAVS
jgi:SPP1 family predicted phage head-tail adaptor